jgi:hypothetical protein
LLREKSVGVARSTPMAEKWITLAIRSASQALNRLSMPV